MTTCPDCRRRMQAFYVAARTGEGEVELDRCAQCGALWFNAGEVEQALGRTVRRRQGSSSRSCPTCRVKLEAAVLEGRIEVERCGTCQGVFLDGHDVAGLGTARGSYRTEGGSGFECEACHERLRRSHHHRHGAGVRRVRVEDVESRDARGRDVAVGAGTAARLVSRRMRRLHVARARRPALAAADARGWSATRGLVPQPPVRVPLSIAASRSKCSTRNSSTARTRGVVRKSRCTVSHTGSLGSSGIGRCISSGCASPR